MDVQLVVGIDIEDVQRRIFLNYRPVVDVKGVDNE